MSRLILIIFVIGVIFIVAESSVLSEDILEGVLNAKDGVAISYEVHKNGFDSVIIVCPGFYNSKSNRWMQKTVDLLSSEHDVIIFDFRGHGDSSGKYTWSAKEHLDVDAVLDFAVKEGYKKIGIVAFSLGAAAAVNSAVDRDEIGSMILISCPTSFKMINFHFWKLGMFSDLMDNINCKWEGKGARTDHILIPKEKPIKIICEIKDVPILFIHGEKDWVVKDLHSRKLYDATVSKKKIEIIKGGLHAERLIQYQPDRIQELMLDWFKDTLK
ncbi:MAG: alpha/beta hydrolase [Candidatus Omnitrophica bacterium]|nr:alpha/beta hydrolase [Candidatus Omnitrophota bacterium]